MRSEIASGCRFEAEIGYRRAVVDGDWVFVSGTTGFDDVAMTVAPDVREQRVGGVRPAATMFVAGLADPRMRIEIEVTAGRRG